MKLFLPLALALNEIRSSAALGDISLQPIPSRDVVDVAGASTNSVGLSLGNAVRALKRKDKEVCTCEILDEELDQPMRSALLNECNLSQQCHLILLCHR